MLVNKGIGELACNRAWTHMRNPNMDGEKYNYYACPVSLLLHNQHRFVDSTALRMLIERRIKVHCIQPILTDHPLQING